MKLKRRCALDVALPLAIRVWAHHIAAYAEPLRYDGLPVTPRDGGRKSRASSAVQGVPRARGPKASRAAIHREGAPYGEQMRQYLHRGRERPGAEAPSSGVVKRAACSCRREVSGISARKRAQG